MMTLLLAFNSVALEYYDLVTLAVLLVLIIGLMLGIYALFIVHRNKNVYSRQLSDASSSEHVELLEEEPIAEENISIEETLKEEVNEESVHQHNLILHEEVMPTCEAQGMIKHYECLECKMKFADEEAKEEVKDIIIAKLDHELNQHLEVEPTCIDKGNVQYFECLKCGKLFADQNAITELTSFETLALGHELVMHKEVNATCMSDGIMLHYECSRCHKLFADEEAKEEIVNVVISKTTHNLVKHETVEPTITENGCKEYYECCECHKLFVDEEAKEEVELSSLIIEALGEAVVEEAKEEAIEEVKEEVVQSTLASHQMEDLIKESITVEEAQNAIADSELKALVEHGKLHPKYKGAKKEKFIINVDVVSDRFENGETVDLNSLKAKNLLPKKCNYFKVLARGVLNKSLTFIANDFSNDAVKMILVTGGKVIQLEEE